MGFLSVALVILSLPHTMLESIERLLYLEVRKMMLNSLTQPVVRPLYNGRRVALQGTYHHLHSMLVDILTQINTTIIFLFLLKT